MDLFKELTKNVIINNEQGYAFYYYHNGNKIEKTFGKTVDEESADIKFDTNFRLASVSKQFIAFGITALKSENKLSYEDNVLSIFPDLPEYLKDVKIKHLLSHRSGIYDYEDMPHDDTQIHDEDILTFLKTTSTTYFTPGTSFKYSNTAFILLGLIIKKVSKMSIGEFLDMHIFKKAGMNNSTVNYEGITQIKNRAYGHILTEDNKMIVKDQYWCSATIGDGGVYSSINDLKKWIKFLVNSTNFKDMINPVETSNHRCYDYYGFGLGMSEINNNKIYYHCGDTIGTDTFIMFSKDLNLCLIFLTNLGEISTSQIKKNVFDIFK